MKKIFLSLIVAMVTVTVFAQTSTVATLTHGDQISMFYGAFAFRDAHAAAENGDVINLSGGAFQSTEISKAIIVRGAGVEDAYPTFITGDFNVNIPSEVSDRLSFEGCRLTGAMTVQGTLNNVYFLKSYLGRINVSDESNFVNGMFVNCQVYAMDLRGNSGVQFINSYVENFVNNGESTATAAFMNCTIQVPEGHYARYMPSSEFTNCIFIFGSGYGEHYAAIPATSSTMNCLAIGGSDCNYAFNFIQSKQNCQTLEGMEIFQDSDPMKDLTEEAKAKYLGTDGTPIGMYGGIMPFNMIPSYPRITKMNVANKTTADGKLSVEIEVSAEN